MTLFCFKIQQLDTVFFIHFTYCPKKSHKKYFIHHESLEILQQIRELYTIGKSIDEDILTQKGVQVTFTVKTTNEDNERVTVRVTVYGKLKM